MGWWSLGIFAMVILVVGCKHEDGEPPATALSLPGDGFVVVANSEFEVAGRASDNEGLVSVTAVLFETFTEQIVQTTSIAISGMETDFSFRMPAGDRYTEGGDYTLRVTAADKAGNEGSAFLQITVQALPLEFKGLVWAGESGGGAFSIFTQDTAGNVLSGPGGLNSMVDLLMDSRNGQIVAAQSNAGVLSAWDFEEFTPMFQTTLPQGTGTETFSGIAMNRNGFYAAVRVPEYLRSYRFDGSPKNNFEQVLYPGTAVMATSDKVYLGVSGILGSPRKVDVYDIANESLEATQVLDWDVLRILAIDADEILVCGNSSGLGRIFVLDRQSLIRNQETELLEGFRDAMTANGRVWVLTDSGMMEYFPSNGTLSSVLMAGDFSALGVDAARNRLFIGSTDRIDIVTGAGALLGMVQGGFGDVRFISTYYNR